MLGFVLRHSLGLWKSQLANKKNNFDDYNLICEKGSNFKKNKNKLVVDYYRYCKHVLSRLESKRGPSNIST